MLWEMKNGKDNGGMRKDKYHVYQYSIKEIATVAVGRVVYELVSRSCRQMVNFTRVCLISPSLTPFIFQRTAIRDFKMLLSPPRRVNENWFHPALLLIFGKCPSLSPTQKSTIPLQGARARTRTRTRTLWDVQSLCWLFGRSRPRRIFDISCLSGLDGNSWVVTCKRLGRGWTEQIRDLA